MLAAQKARATTQVDLFLVEKSLADYRRLDEVASEYRARGANVETRHGDCGAFLDEAIAGAVGASMFLFLDPCGANLPWDQVVTALKSKRSKWPRTEALLNFSAGLTRRAGGQVKAGQLDADGVKRLDKVCGGEWWRAVALQAHFASGGNDWEAAANSVADEYGARLAHAVGMSGSVTPVLGQIGRQPIYHLVFLTHGPQGLWVMGDALAAAHEKWLRTLGPSDEQVEGMLFNTSDHVVDQLRQSAIERVRANLEALLDDGRPKAVSHHTAEIFGQAYGLAREKDFTASLRALVREGRAEIVTRGKKPHQHVIRGVASA